nr:uncharacterized protein LOC124813535 [Hydra vulgaris]
MVWKPSSPLSIFHCVKSSLVLTAPPKSRVTTSSAGTRNIQADQLETFKAMDSLNFNDLIIHYQKKKIPEDLLNCIVVYKCDEKICFQSTEFYCGLPKFIPNLSSNLKYETYHCGCLCYVTSLSKNHLTILDK